MHAYGMHMCQRVCLCVCAHVCVAHAYVCACNVDI